ncbi:MAG TPA: FAD-binding oxidoreductase [Ktedonobacteraceae bacterium]|jgi:glycine/D-amino acid oxidase-like deaminating enzyme
MQTTEPSQPTFVPVSYWQHTSPQLSLSNALPSTVDVLVVGSGLFGAATAYWLARAGKKVALVDRVGIAYGASGRNGGFVVAGMHEDYPAAVKRLGQRVARAVLEVSYANQAILRQVLEEEEIACHYREPGSLGLALGEEQALEVRQSIEALNADGFPVQWLERAEVQKLIYTPLGSEIVGAKFLPGQALVHSARLIQGLVQAAQRHGAHIYQARVLSLMQEGGSVRVETSSGNIHAGAVVLAVNAWTSELIPEMHEIIVPVRGQILAYAPLAPVFTTAIFASLTETEEYWQQTLDGSLILGGCRALAPGKDVGVWDTSTTQEVQTALEHILPRLFPQLSGLQVTQRWAGLMDFTPDRIPLVDRVPGLDNAWFVGGLSGHGMPFGMLLGQYLAQAVQANKDPEALWPFKLERETLKNYL